METVNHSRPGWVFWAALLITLMTVLGLVRPAPVKAQDTETPTPTETATSTATMVATMAATEDTATPTPNVKFVTTLSSGQAVEVQFTMTGGEALISVLLLIIIGLFIFCLFVVLTSRKP